ncbi:MAG: type II toxin-antitoxin system RelB/DinJ family antitoxin [Bifidobacterium tibiigranuli]|jgi:DNA-damage-inducible protein J|uniref:type II toxin-antitoxin system RelB/DinJ family antitoxin n=1 Tax=Bifidobacterium tibiigranuli TaxID=2172043 RepID=UPI002354CF74|nr:type II toxin-antitoxin system RelB/DinJ family antitoxin [Bifidobacterium tibiigranuli]MCH3975196.1 type II toxin-antitoxin system RelB/DinJ family antitoxin [Bifidobacterium tibiigranuli]MCH4203394.1 type II toxin-antitoxin system RelB/DinJ family antitoxin [Bifidobacterium tibiigranuli]MCH4273994.1 type II toxin-antitoxin system RelB/DinJ family antitoxin [Bifidobacterium tibiigranuli]
MTTSMVRIRMDEQTKREMDKVCKDLGLSMSAAFNLFAKTVVRERRIPFEISADPFYSAENMEHLRRGAAQLDAGLGQAHDVIG